jgi:hypothetical protein
MRFIVTGPNGANRSRMNSGPTLANLRLFVMLGLVPGIPIKLARRCQKYRDGRDKPGHDGTQIRLFFFFFIGCCTGAG